MLTLTRGVTVSQVPKGGANADRSVFGAISEFATFPFQNAFQL